MLRTLATRLSGPRNHSPDSAQTREPVPGAEATNVGARRSIAIALMPAAETLGYSRSPASRASSTRERISSLEKM